MDIIENPDGTEILVTSFGRGILAKRLIGIIGINVITGTGYTLRRGDAGNMIKTTNGSAVSILVQPESIVAFPLLNQVLFKQEGAGQVTFVAGAGVTINSPETLKISKQYAQASLIYEGGDLWTLGGYLATS